MPSAWFAACSLALSLSQPAPAPFPYPEGAGIDFRNQTNQGVALVAGGEGTTEIGEWDGVRCLQTSAAEQAYYVYLQIPGDFIRPGRDTLTFEVEYLDNGRGPVLLQVESALPCIAIGGFSYRVAGQLWRAGSGRWRTARWQVTDEAFADPARQAVRFRLFAEEWVPGDRTLRVASVRVSHAAIRMEPEHQVLLCRGTTSVHLGAFDPAGEPLPDGTPVALRVRRDPAALTVPEAVLLQNGEATFEVAAGAEAGSARLVASTGDLRAELPLHVVEGAGEVAEQTVEIAAAELAQGAGIAGETTGPSTVELLQDENGVDVLACSFTGKTDRPGEDLVLELNAPIPGLPERFCVMAGSDDQSVESLLVDLTDRDGEVFVYVLKPLVFGQLDPFAELQLDCRARSYPTYGARKLNMVMDLPCTFARVRARLKEGLPEGHLRLWGVRCDVEAPLERAP